MSAPFGSERARNLLQRGRHQLDAVRNSLEEWDSQVSSSMCGELSPPSAFAKRRGLRPGAMPAIDHEIELELFDGVGNVIKSLDRTMALLAAKAGQNGDVWRGEFPIATRPEDYVAVSPKKVGRRERLMGDFDPRAVDIIDRAQPYLDAKPRIHPLARLARWARLDKHRLGHPSIVVARGSAIFLHDDATETITIFDMWKQMPSSGRSTPIRPDTDILGLFPLAALEPLLPYLASDPRTRTPGEVTVVLRTAVAFGPAYDRFPDIAGAVDWTAQSVLEPLWVLLDT